MKSFTKEIYIEPEIAYIQKRYRVTTHNREGRIFYHRIITKRFMTQQEAKAYQAEELLKGGRLLRSDVIPTQDFTDLPDIRAWKDPDGTLTVTVDGRTVIANTTDPRALRDAIRAHPKAELLTPRPCRRCGAKPRVNFTLNRLYHLCESHDVKIVEPLIPIGIKIAAWNLHFSRRRKAITVVVSVPHLIALGFLREPSERDFNRHLRKVEVIEE